MMRSTSCTLHPELVSGSKVVPALEQCLVPRKWMLKLVQHDGSGD